jgi:hypothetical protein
MVHQPFCLVALEVTLAGYILQVWLKGCWSEPVVIPESMVKFLLRELGLLRWQPMAQQ